MFHLVTAACKLGKALVKGQKLPKRCEALRDDRSQVAHVIDKLALQARHYSSIWRLPKPHVLCILWIWPLWDVQMKSRSPNEALMSMPLYLVSMGDAQSSSV